MPEFPWPVVDHHAHLRPGPSAIAATTAFRKLGGTHIFLATQNYTDHVPTSLEEYASQYGTTSKIAHAVREETGIVTFPVVAPYPVDLVHAAPLMGLPAAEELQKRALALAGGMVREGEAVAIGEVGRAHFKVDSPVAEALERVLEWAFDMAHDSDCPLVIHSDDLDEGGYEGLSEMGRKHGVRPWKVVKHFARTYAAKEQRHGIVPSFLARKELVQDALQDEGPWFLETDFMDDPARPGAVLSPETVPKRAAWISSRPELSQLAKRLTIPFVESPRKVYGLTLERS